jgi:hypothetical protein
MSNLIGKRRASLIRKLVWAYFQSQQMLQIFEFKWKMDVTISVQAQGYGRF